MLARAFAGLLLSILLGISLLRPECQAKALPGSERMKRSSGTRLARQAWPAHLSQDQKHLISQFLPHLYASELAAQRNNLNEAESHFPSWMDFGRRSSENLDGDP